MFFKIKIVLIDWAIYESLNETIFKKIILAIAFNVNEFVSKSGIFINQLFWSEYEISKSTKITVKIKINRHL